MKHYTEVIIPARITNEVSHITCDLCKNKIQHKSSYDVDEVTVSYRTGRSYPEGGDGTETEFDICNTCFTEKLVPWLIFQGAVPTITPWEHW